MSYTPFQKPNFLTQLQKPKICLKTYIQATTLSQSHCQLFKPKMRLLFLPKQVILVIIKKHIQPIATSSTSHNPLNTTTVFSLKKRKTNNAFSSSLAPHRALKKKKTYLPSTSNQTALEAKAFNSDLRPVPSIQPES